MGDQPLLDLELDLKSAVCPSRVTSQLIAPLILKENNPLLQRGKLLITLKYD